MLAGILFNSGIDIIDKDYLKRARQLPWDTLLVLVSHDFGPHVLLLSHVRQFPHITLPVWLSSLQLHHIVSMCC